MGWRKDVFPQKQRSQWDVTTSALLRCVWHEHERNEHIFNDKAHQFLSVLAKINHFVDFSLGHVSAKAKVTLQYGRRNRNQIECFLLLTGGMLVKKLLEVLGLIMLLMIISGF